MNNYLEILSSWMNEPHYLLIILILVYVIAAVIDFLVGMFGAIYNDGEEFSSRVAQLGIVRKVVTLSMMILIVPLALMLPYHVAIYSLTILYLGIAGSEIYSILGNIGLVKDADKQNKIVGKLFSEILGNIFSSKKVEDKGDVSNGK